MSRFYFYFFFFLIRESLSTTGKLRELGKSSRKKIRSRMEKDLDKEKEKEGIRESTKVLHYSRGGSVTYCSETKTQRRQMQLRELRELQNADAALGQMGARGTGAEEGEPPGSASEESADSSIYYVLYSTVRDTKYERGTNVEHSLPWHRVCASLVMVCLLVPAR